MHVTFTGNLFSGGKIKRQMQWYLRLRSEGLEKSSFFHGFFCLSVFSCTQMDCRVTAKDASGSKQDKDADVSGEC